MRADVFEPSPAEGESHPREGHKLARRIRVRLELVIFTLIVIIGTLSISGDADTAFWHSQSHEALSIHNARIEGLAFAQDGKLAASASRDGTVMVWDVGPKPSWGVAVKNSAGFSSIAFAPDGKTVAAGGLDSTIASLGRRFRRSSADFSKKRRGGEGSGFRPRGRVGRGGRRRRRCPHPGRLLGARDARHARPSSCRQRARLLSRRANPRFSRDGLSRHPLGPRLGPRPEGV